MPSPFDSGLGYYTQWVHSACPHWTRNHSTETRSTQGEKQVRAKRKHPVGVESKWTRIQSEMNLQSHLLGRWREELSWHHRPSCWPHIPPSCGASYVPPGSWPPWQLQSGPQGCSTEDTPPSEELMSRSEGLAPEVAHSTLKPQELRLRAEQSTAG